MRPILIGVAGASGSGKSERARRLMDRLPGSASLFTLDSYYQPLNHLTPQERALVNFDNPASLDEKLLIAQLQQLAAGQAIARPEYSFSSHTRTGVFEIMPPTDYVVVEGLFSLYWKEIRDLLRLKVYVETPDHICFERRLSRDVLERGRTPECIQAQYDETVRPMAFEFVRPTSEFADLTISGLDSYDHFVTTVLSRLQVEPRVSAVRQVLASTANSGVVIPVGS
jgi:uridine kinase